ncbi:MAG: NADH:ubiquinone reductase (Na(+)-transporting) subunit C [Cyclobacteriaceae bacterium]
MRQSNLYIILFSVGLTVVLGFLLSWTSVQLGPLQKIQEELDTKTKILAAVMDISKEDPVLDVYKQRIQSLVVDIDGNVIENDEKGAPLVAENVNIEKNYKLSPEERQYPVFKFMNEKDTSKVDYYILPLFGNGLWDVIWGYVALEGDLNTIKGVVYDHRGETPGLGARITEALVQERYQGQQIYDLNGDLVSVSMLKGENNGQLDKHHVDGMSGATITANGVNKMLKDYLNYYQAYLKKIAS